jgi:hypothetical protein
MSWKPYPKISGTASTGSLGREEIKKKPVINHQDLGSRFRNPTVWADSRYWNPTVRPLVFMHDAARGTNDFLWGIFSLQNPIVRAGFRSRNPTVRASSASQLKREQTPCCNYI